MPFLSKNATRSCDLTPARRKPCATCAERDKSCAQVKVRSPKTRETAFGCLRALSRTTLATSPTFKPGFDFLVVFFALFFLTVFLALFFLADFFALFLALFFALFFLALFFALFFAVYLTFDFLRFAIGLR